MAGDWIQMRCDLAEDPAVIGIAAKVKLDEFAVVGRLHTLWSWADRQSRDGHAAGVTHVFLDRKVQCEGFAKAMCDVGWLTLDIAGVKIPNFERYMGKSSKTRALNARRQQNHRSSVTPGVTDESRKQSRTERDKSVTREEKRREEKEEKTGASAPVDWIPIDAWQAFVDHRKAKRAKLTPKAVELLVKKLADYRASGVEPRTVLDFAIESGHTGLYYKPPQKSSNGHAVNGSAPAMAGWTEFRVALRAAQKPERWTHERTEAAIDAIGGWQALRYAESRDLDFKQNAFVAAFNAGAH